MGDAEKPIVERASDDDNLRVFFRGRPFRSTRSLRSSRTASASQQSHKRAGLGSIASSRRGRGSYVAVCGPGGQSAAASSDISEHSRTTRFCSSRS